MFLAPVAAVEEAGCSEVEDKVQEVYLEQVLQVLDPDYLEDQQVEILAVYLEEEMHPLPVEEVDYLEEDHPLLEDCFLQTKTSHSSLLPCLVVVLIIKTNRFLDQQLNLLQFLDQLLIILHQEEYLVGLILPPQDLHYLEEVLLLHNLSRVLLYLVLKVLLGLHQLLLPLVLLDLIIHYLDPIQLRQPHHYLVLLLKLHHPLPHYLDHP